MATLDIRMNDFAPATDGKYIYGEDTNGNQVKIPFVSILKSFLRVPVYFDIDLNNLETGIIYARDIAKNGPESSWLYVISIRAEASSDVFQMAYSVASEKLYVRACNSSAWMPWKSISLT